MADTIKRLNYFTGQFLDAQDFKDEQAYLKEMRWRDNQILFSPGVRVGLVVVASAAGTGVTVSPGVAFDDQGRELVILPSTTGQPNYSVPPGMTGTVNVVISYEEILSDSHSVGGYTGATRVTESPRVEVRSGALAGSQILLATLQVDVNGSILSVDISKQQLSHLHASRVGIGTTTPQVALDVVGTAMISDGSGVAASSGYMRKGSLTVGGVSGSFGGGTNWNANTAALLLETSANTEVAVHDSNTRLASLLFYEGDANNRVTIGRDMGWGPLATVAVAAKDVTVAGLGSAIELGAGVADKESNAGKIAFKRWGDQLDIVGAGAQHDRRIRFWAEQGSTFSGAVKVEGSVQVDDSLKASVVSWGESDNRTERRNDAGAMGADVRSGFYQTDTPTNFPPGAGGWWHLLDVRHSNPGNNYAMQFSGGFFDQDLWFRKTNNNGAAPWQRAVLADAAGNVPARVGISGMGATLELGAGVADKQFHAGKIAYGAFGDQLDIVGGGANQERRIKFWAEQGASFSGNLAVDGTLQAGAIEVGNGVAFIATDLIFGHPDRRGSPGRALVDDFHNQDKSQLTINYGGDWHYTKIGGVVSTPSSRKVKDDIRSLSGEVARTIVSALEPVSFHFKRDPTKAECLGFIAEDTPPEVAAADGEAIIVNHIVAALTKVVKDQQELVEALRARLSRLERMAEPAGVTSGWFAKDRFNPRGEDHE
jgi:hypothetical protein